MDIIDPLEMIKTWILKKELGLDTDFAISVISWTFECYEKGLLTEMDTDGFKLEGGSVEAFIEMLINQEYLSIKYGETLSNRFLQYRFFSIPFHHPPNIFDKKWIIMISDKWFLIDLFQEFPRRLASQNKNKVFLIVNGHPVHSIKEIKLFKEESPFHWTLFFNRATTVNSILRCC